MCATHASEKATQGKQSRASFGASECAVKREPLGVVGALRGSWEGGYAAIPKPGNGTA